MTDEIEEAIAMLTPAERDAVCGRFSFANEIEQEEGEDRLHDLGIWHARTHGRATPLTDFGRKVRQRLEMMSTPR
jgi:hypothetical protein